MVGVMGIIFLLLDETPWWLAGKGRLDQAEKVLLRYNGHIDGYDVQEQINVMTATIAEERHQAKAESQEGQFAVFQGRNLIRPVSYTHLTLPTIYSV